ncbi:dynactin subunit 4-like [Liolophura sinensis]|uniref:dynactin subunit 4-like n=1 Tax=Liolophura sinensis TaxID=3198878 RepID=UPI0031592226
MATYYDVDTVQYQCCCGKRRPLCRLYICRHCLKLRCTDCVLHEVDSYYCPNCLENMPSAEATMKNNRCSNCFDCPSCGHTLSTRATTVAVVNPEDATKSTTKKMYYLACGFCRLTTRDVGVADQTVASGGWKDLENPHTGRISSLLDIYRQLAQKEKAEKERKKYTKRRTHLYYTDKFGLAPVAAKMKALPSMSSLSIKEDELIADIKPGETVNEFPSLPDELFSDPIQVAKVTSMSQRLGTPEFQPDQTSKLYPIHKQLLIRRSLRCKQCEHNLSKPDFNPVSIKFKIQLVALHHVPEIRILKIPSFELNKETQLVLTLCNPLVYNTTINLLAVDGEDDFSTAKVKLPESPIVLARRDDAAVYDDTNNGQPEFKDDPSVIVFRLSNKIGFNLSVTPEKADEEIKVSFILRHEYKNTAAALPNEDKEPEIVPLDHRIFLHLGKLPQK